MKLHLPCKLLASVLACICAAASFSPGADVISVSFGEQQIASTKTAGLVTYTVGGVETALAGTYWNQANSFSVANGTGVDLKAYRTGETLTEIDTTAQITWSSKLLYNGDTEITDSSTGDQQMLKSYLDDGDGVSITINNLDFLTYDVYLYCNTDDDQRQYSSKTVNGVSYSASGTATDGNYTTLAGSSAAWGNTGGSQGDTSLEAAPVLGVNTLLIEDLYADTLTIGSLKSGNNRGCIAGLQIVDTYGGTKYAASPAVTGATWTETTLAGAAWADATQAAGTYASLTLSGDTTLTISGDTDNTRDTGGIVFTGGNLTIEGGSLNMTGPGVVRTGGNKLTVNSAFSGSLHLIDGDADLTNVTSTLGTLTVDTGRTLKVNVGSDMGKFAAVLNAGAGAGMIKIAADDAVGYSSIAGANELSEVNVTSAYQLLDRNFSLLCDSPMTININEGGSITSGYNLTLYKNQTMNISGGALSVSGLYIGGETASSVTLSSGSLTASNGINLQQSGSSFSMTGGTLDLNGKSITVATGVTATVSLTGGKVTSGMSTSGDVTLGAVTLVVGNVDYSFTGKTLMVDTLSIGHTGDVGKSVQLSDVYVETTKLSDFEQGTLYLNAEGNVSANGFAGGTKYYLVKTDGGYIRAASLTPGSTVKLVTNGDTSADNLETALVVREKKDGTLLTSEDIGTNYSADAFIYQKAEQKGTVYYVNTGTETYNTSETTGITATTTTGIVLNGGNLNMVTGLDETMTDGITVQKAATLTLGNAVELNASKVSNSAAQKVTLKGSGTYVATDASQLKSGDDTYLIDGTNTAWTGTVLLDGVTLSGLKFGKLGNKATASVVELSGVSGYVDTGNHDANLKLTNTSSGAAAITLNNGNSSNDGKKNNLVNFTGAISGSGDFVRSCGADGTAGGTFHGGKPLYRFSGNITDWKGSFIVKDADESHRVTNTTYLQFTDSATTINADIVNNATGVNETNSTEGDLQVTIENASAVAVNGDIMGNTSVSYSGTGTKTVNSTASNYTAGTSIADGEVTAKTNAAFGSGAVTLANGGKVKFTDGATSIAQTINSTTEEAGTGTVTIANANAVAVSASITGKAAVAYSGAGTKTVSSTGSTYEGGTTISDGKVLLQSDGGLGTGDVEMTGAGNLEVATGGSLNVDSVSIAEGATGSLSVTGGSVTATTITNKGTGATGLFVTGGSVLVKDTLTDKSSNGISVTNGTLDAKSISNDSHSLTLSGTGKVQLHDGTENTTKVVTLSAASTATVATATNINLMESHLISSAEFGGEHAVLSNVKMELFGSGQDMDSVYYMDLTNGSSIEFSVGNVYLGELKIDATSSVTRASESVANAVMTGHNVLTFGPSVQILSAEEPQIYTVTQLTGVSLYEGASTLTFNTTSLNLDATRDAVFVFEGLAGLTEENFIAGTGLDGYEGFTVTGGNTVTFAAVAASVPEPATATLSLLALAALAARRRRK